MILYKEKKFLYKKIKNIEGNDRTIARLSP